MDSFGRILEILITVVLLFLVPLNYMATKQDMICQTYINTETSYLVDSVRNLGYLSESMYQTFLKRIHATNHVYEISFTHYKQVTDLIYEEGKEETEAEYANNYYGIYTEEISGMMETDKIYKMKQGDYFVLKIQNVDKTLSVKLKELFLNRKIEGAQILVVYGGAIRDEAY